MAYFPLIVIGAGPAGLAAAAEAGRAGVPTLLVDERAGPGGSVTGPLPDSVDSESWMLPPVLHQARRHEVEAVARDCRDGGVETVFNAFAWAVFREDRWLVPVLEGGRTATFAADYLILATGNYVAPAPRFDLAHPAVLTPPVFYRGLITRRMAGRALVIYGDGLCGRALEAAAAAHDAPVQAVIPSSRPPQVEPLPGGRLRIDLDGRDAVEADHLIITAPVNAAYELAALAGCRLTFTGYEGYYRPRVGARMQTTAAGVYTVGGLAGFCDLTGAMESGRLAARDVATRLGSGDPAARVTGVPDIDIPPAEGVSQGRVLAPVQAGPDCRETDRPACPCMGRTVNEVIAAAEAGAATFDDLKRMTGIGMGRCQGRRCGRTALGILERAASGDQGSARFAPELAGPMRVRPPIRPITLAGLLSRTGGDLRHG